MTFSWVGEVVTPGLGPREGAPRTAARRMSDLLRPPSGLPPPLPPIAFPAAGGRLQNAHLSLLMLFTLIMYWLPKLANQVVQQKQQ